MMGSASVPTTLRLGNATTLFSTRWLRFVTSARQPGSMTVVALASLSIAGPSSRSPGSSASRSKIGVWSVSPVMYAFVSAMGSSGASRLTASRSGSSGLSVTPMASMDTASTSRRLSGMTKP